MKKLVFEDIPLDKIDLSRSNVRRANAEEGIDDLAASIREIGLQQPVVVIRKGDRYELIIGQRRFLACKSLKLEKIPALITTVRNETEAVIKSFVENIHRLDLDYRDKMQVATELMDRLRSVPEVAKRLGVSEQTVRNWLGYQAVPETVKKLVDERRLSATTATRIAARIPDQERALKIAQRVIELPRSADRIQMINTATQNPKKSLEEIIRIADAEKKRNITVYLTETVARALDDACQKYGADPEEIMNEALEGWLRTKGFID